MDTKQNKSIDDLYHDTRKNIEKYEEALTKLAESEKKYRELVEFMPTIVFEVDSQGYLSYVNKKALELLGYYRDEIIGTNLLDIIVEGKQVLGGPSTQNILLQYIDITIEYTFLKKDGSPLPVHIYINKTFQNNQIVGARGIAIDITNILRTQQKLKNIEKKHDAIVKHAIYNALHDRLTDVFNREMFLTRLEVEIIKATKRKRGETIFAVMCLGVDRFKWINEMHGATVGDELLQVVARRLSGTIRNDDTLARFYGDKFFILLSDIGYRDGITHIIKKLLSIFSSPFEIEGNSLQVTSSIGVCIFPDDAEDEEGLLEKAEGAMYLAKEKGRNRYQLFDGELHNRMVLRFQLGKELETATINDEFIPFYQPTVNRDASLAGMEVLARWESPKRGLVSPVQFIPIMEENGMIHFLGVDILRKSCTQNQHWQKNGHLPVYIAVNLSPYQLSRDDLVESVETILKETGLDPRWLELEITESGLIENEEDCIKKLLELRNMGISIAIDDFGTGYSSLSKLQDYPIDTLKIDKSFVDKILINYKAAAITRYTIQLAHDLGFTVVAEGVETKEQFEFLLKENCDRFQGYYFCKPVPATDFEIKLFGEPEE
ncbi:MAG: EAL domain-containing protein [bacterium]|nr:EAL domain-containing protein [bacterium]